MRKSHPRSSLISGAPGAREPSKRSFLPLPVFILLFFITLGLGRPPLACGDSRIFGWGGLWPDDYGLLDVPPGLTNVVQIAIGSFHGLALKNDGTVAAWGATGGADYGQATIPNGLSNVIAVACGSSHSLALRRDGTVVAWGYNMDNATNVPAALSNVVQILGGMSHSAALSSDGTITVWGSGPNSPITLHLTKVVAISGDGDDLAAIKADGTFSSIVGGVLSTASLLQDLTNVTIVAGYYNIGGAALTTDSEVVLRGKCPVTGAGEAAIDLATLPSLSNVLDVVRGGIHYLALGRDGRVVGWGDDYYGQSSVPWSIPPGIVAISAGYYSSFALEGDGPPFITAPLLDRTAIVDEPFHFRISATGRFPLSYQWRCNGTNLPGATNTILAFQRARLDQSGVYSVVVSNSIGSITNRPCKMLVLPFDITMQPTRRSTYAGGSATFSVETRGSLPLRYQWYHDGIAIFGETNATLAITNVLTEQAGHYSVAVNNDEASITSTEVDLLVLPVAIWPDSQSDAVQGPEQLTNVLSLCVASAMSFGLAIRGDHTLVSWGRNESGETNIPPGLTNVVAAAGTSGYVVLAVKSDGTVTSWGDNNEGRTSMPQGLTNVVAVAGGYAHGLALKADGTLAAWGRYYSYNRLQFFYNPGYANVVQIASGMSHAVALMADGTVRAWGDNQFGQCAVPSGLKDVVAISCGNDSTLALTSDGQVIAWGTSNGDPLYVPTNLTNAIAIAAGGRRFGFALRADGTVATWGTYYANGSLQDMFVPPGLKQVVGIAAGSTFGMAVMGDNSHQWFTPVFAPQQTSDTFSCTVQTERGRIYRLEFTDSLSAAQWRMSPQIAGDGKPRVLRDANPGIRQRFYRVRRF